MENSPQTISGYTDIFTVHARSELLSKNYTENIMLIALVTLETVKYVGIITTEHRLLIESNTKWCMVYRRAPIPIKLSDFQAFPSATDTAV